MKIYCNHLVIADKVNIADTFMKRFFGLMGKKKLDFGEGLLLLNCPSIHCFFMKISIDVIYLSEEMTVEGVETLKPWSIGKHYKKTAHVLELREGSVNSKVNLGDRIVLSRDSK
ncbi:DUF192 domain-containing protein [Anaerovorax sp. IOR16]|uniref:DUF192 domain-containing protein n=1 Tax=Anaerovorax sp. IOR16 TaxID=2773458 RepID=UPI0019D23832|nr:DUF192 domain-containing protein [Anaerovorax sp. IOR16]